MLRQLFDKYMCDKGSLRHRYDRVYSPIFQQLRKKKFNMLEVGILHGNSFRAWLEYCPQVQLYGIDIFKRMPAELISVLKNKRVHWCKCNSIKGPYQEFEKMVDHIKFDVIIDDGLHYPSAQRQTFKNFIPYLKKDGVYFIEDVWPLDIMTKKERNHYWLKKYSNQYNDIEYNKLLKALKSYNITFHDLREDTEPDSFIIEVKQ